MEALLIALDLSLTLVYSDGIRILGWVSQELLILGWTGTGNGVHLTNYQEGRADE